MNLTFHSSLNSEISQNLKKERLEVYQEKKIM